jgi:hypothetical protein
MSLLHGLAAIGGALMLGRLSGTSQSHAETLLKFLFKANDALIGMSGSLSRGDCKKANDELRLATSYFGIATNELKWVIDEAPAGESFVVHGGFPVSKLGLLADVSDVEKDLRSADDSFRRLCKVDSRKLLLNG